MDDVIVVGKCIPGLIAGVMVAKTGKRVTVVPNPGPISDSRPLPFFIYRADDIWGHFLSALNVSIPKNDIIEPRSSDVPAFVYTSPNSHMGFRRTENISDILTAHNTFLPEDFFSMLTHLKEIYTKDRQWLVTDVWPHISKHPEHIPKILRTRTKQLTLLRAYESWEWEHFFQGLSMVWNASKPYVFAHLFQMCDPQGKMANGGAETVAEWLLTEIAKHGGNILSDARWDSLFIDHQEVKGVICAFPHGVQYGHRVLLNSALENLSMQISENASLPTLYSQNLDPNPQMASWSEVPQLSTISLAVSPSLSNHYVITQRVSEHFLAASCQKVLTDPLEGFTPIGLPRTYPACTYSTASHTLFPNVRYGTTATGKQEGNVNALLEGIALAHWCGVTMANTVKPC